MSIQVAHQRAFTASVNEKTLVTHQRAFSAIMPATPTSAWKPRVILVM